MAGAQPALHFGGRKFLEISFDDAIVLIQPWYNFFANGHNVFLPADTKSVVYKHTHAAQRWLIKTKQRFTTALEAKSLVSSEISDLRNF